jgi:putative tricarboxylic transport membrane protein
MTEDIQENTVATEEKKPLPKGEIKMLVLLFCIGAALFVDSLRVKGIFEGASAGPGSIPQMVSLAIILMVVGIGVTLYRQGYKEGSIKDVILYLFDREVVMLLITVSLYGVLVEPLGFVASTIIFLVSTMYLLDRKQLVKKVIISVATVAVLVLIFSTFFQVVLP